MTDQGISVVIPTYEALDITEKTLLAVAADLAALPVPSELVVVDNESCPLTATRLKALCLSASGTFLRRAGLAGRHFQPGAARNVGIDLAKHDCIVLLDADCIPGSRLIAAYWQAMQTSSMAVYLGRREFIDSTGVSAQRVSVERSALDALPRVPSASNYFLPEDRRLAELRHISGHPRPYDLMHTCNMAVRRSHLRGERFNPVFDGHWGYEDIELGHRLFQAGLQFCYIPAAVAYHQEGEALDSRPRAGGRLRNFALAEGLIPGFSEYRIQSARAGAHPDKANFGES